ncbi:hypothetical protein L195_g018645 [Trifolium pratense]|uniref:Zinc knuckle CX2CX4HX4C domain-containing protein n=1 Tax=Trifolium pratense TaxID=57577 RepID=A0A2K3MXC3_TRIPR|nr:hypothetical protein L195_g018645 [Trifolium pratense]
MTQIQISQTHPRNSPSSAARPRILIPEAQTMQQNQQSQSTDATASPFILKLSSMKEIEGGILQFFMNKNIDQERILLGNPWIFRNSWLIVKAWDRNTDPQTVDFSHAPVWIQLWGLPPHCKTKKMGESIGNLLGKVETAEFYEYPGKKMIIKVKVAINVHEPIQTGILIGNHKDGTTWIDFRYEKLPQICFKCGILGHGENLCQNEPLNMEEAAPLGPWIRSNQYGRRVMEEKDRKYHSNPSLSKTFGKYSPPIPASMLAQMEAMKLQEEAPAESSRFSKTTNNATTTNGDGKGSWHRTARNTTQCMETLEAPHLAEPQPLVKRPRVEDSWREDTSIQRAGPAGQASQSS